MRGGARLSGAAAPGWWGGHPGLLTFTRRSGPCWHFQPGPARARACASSLASHKSWMRFLRNSPVGQEQEPAALRHKPRCVRTRSFVREVRLSKDV